MSKRVAILIFDDVEVLDFCGPFEVFSITGLRGNTVPFEVYTIAENMTVTARNQLSINPHYTLSNCPQPDILVIPGGGGFDAQGNPFGSRREMHNQTLLSWLKNIVPQTEHVLSVCTGALILANAGLTNNLRATTHHKAIDALSECDPTLEVLSNQRFVDNGQCVFSGGISAGIDASFHVVAKVLGLDAAIEAAQYMEYNWQH